MSTPPMIFTIGHSTHPIEGFLDLLRQHAITSVADVRSVPYSRRHPQFNREILIHSLETHGIAYLFLGDELGGRSTDKTCYENGRVQYHRLSRTEAFRRGIGRVCGEREHHQVALMCAEREPLECHRTLLVSRALAATGIPVVHIHADGQVEPHDDAIIRLLRLFHLPDEDLFRSGSDLVDEAYRRQEARIGYVDKRLVGQPYKAGLSPARMQMVGTEGCVDSKKAVT